MVLETKRLLLREMKPDDFQALFLVFGDPETMWHYPYTFDGQHVRDWIERNMNRYRKDGFGLWAVCLKETGELIGDCGLVFANLEQRYFTNFEIATLMPVFAIFESVGETAWDLWDINRKDLVYLIGFGVRFAQTKSISRLVNKVDVSIPLNGVRKAEPHYSIITTYNL